MEEDSQNQLSLTLAGYSKFTGWELSSIYTQSLIMAVVVSHIQAILISNCYVPVDPHYKQI